MKILLDDSNLVEHGSTDKNRKKLALRALIASFALAATIQPASASQFYCNDVFQNAVQTYGNSEDNYVEFEFNARLKHPSSNAISTASVKNNHWSLRKSCGKENCAASTSSLHPLELDELLTTDSQVEIYVPLKKHRHFGKDGISEFAEIDLSAYAQGVFSPENSVYVIDQLRLGYKSSLQLSPGDYWIRDLQMEVDSNIDVIGEGEVNLYVTNALRIPFKAKINEKTKNPAKLAIYTASSAHLEIGSKTFAFIIAKGGVSVGHTAKLTGGILGEQVRLRSESEVTYDARAAQDLSFGSLCLKSGTVVAGDVTPPTIEIDDLESPPTTDTVTITGKISDLGDNATGVATASIQAGETIIPLSLDSGSFSVDVPLEPGVNTLVVSATDNAGNQTSSEVEVEFRSRPEFVLVLINQESPYTPDVVIIGEFRTRWPLGDILFTLEDIPQEITEVGEGIYRFEVPYTLPEYNNLLSLMVAVPGEEPVEIELQVNWEAAP